MTRSFNFITRLISVKGIAAVSLAVTALILPACAGIDEGEELQQDEEPYQEEGIGEEELGEESEGFGRENLGEEETGDD